MAEGGALRPDLVVRMPDDRSMVVDAKAKQGLQQIPTSNGARSLAVSLATNRVYVATTAKGLACRGCIVVYAPE